MEVKTNIRRLLAGSSLVALLGASNAALAAGVTISGGTGPVTITTSIDFIEVTSTGTIAGDLTIQAPNGEIDLQAQGSSFIGVDVNQGDVLGGILNQNQIGVVATSTGLPIGIAVRGAGASIGSTGTSFGIQNDGKITVTGVNSAIGIAVVGSGINFNDGITNNPSAGIAIKVKAHQEADSGQAIAAGILVDVSEGNIGSDITNNATIKVNATELSAVTSGVASATSAAKASGFAHAIASGMGVGVQNSFAGMSSLSSPVLFDGSLDNAGVINVQAQASSTHTALATGSGGFFGNAVGSALGNDTTAQAHGMFATAGAIVGNLTNSGNVGAIATANSVNNATAHGVNSTFTSVGDATALASGRVVATATGMQANANSMSGNMINSGNLGAQAIANTTNVATADSTDTANAKASALGDAYANAYGMVANVGSFVGGFINSSSATLDAFATATAKNTATITGAGSYDGAQALASSSVSASAYGMTGFFDTFGGLAANSGTINVSAVGSVTNNATVQVQGPATATVDNGEYSATADAVGMLITANVLYAASASSTGVSQGGTVGVLAVANANQKAQAKGTSFAQANSDASVAASGSGVRVGVSSFLGDFVNDGHVTVTSLATITSTASAKATGAVAGIADANGNNYAFAGANGVSLYGTSFIGDFVNDTGGIIDVSATAAIVGLAKATGTSNSSAEAALFDRAYAHAGGISLDMNDSFIGNISNAAAITVGALASTINHSTATAPGGGASAIAVDAYAASYARAYGIIANVDSMSGNFLNTGDVDVSAVTREVDSAIASGSDYANAYAASRGVAEATGVSMGVGSTLYGSVSNAGTITVDAVVTVGNYASADATDGNGSASVVGNVVAGALGFAVDGGTVSSDIINSGDITDIAVAGAFNGSVTGELTGFSLVGVGLGALAYYSTGISFGLGGLNGAFATGTSYASARADGYARANAVGFQASVNSVGGDIVNDGYLQVGAIAVTTNEAYAHVTGHGTAYAAADGTGARGNALGMFVSGSTVDGSVVNSSFVGVAALGASLNVAKAEGNSLTSADATARAFGSAFGTAVGIGVDATSVVGGFANFGSVYAAGIAAVYNEASALSAPSGTARATAQDVNRAFANATGISVSGNYLGSFSNDGNVNALGIAVSHNSAAAQSTGLSLANYGYAYAVGSASADATGIYLNESTVAGVISNSATVTAMAAAYVHDDAYAAGDYANAYARNYRAEASATGIYVSAYQAQSGFANTGDIHAFAYAGSLPGAGSPTTSVDSYSTGVGNRAEAYGANYASASVAGSAVANAQGIDFWSEGTVSVLPMSSTAFFNNASINVGARADLSGLAYAHSTGVAFADAGTRDYGADVASATGINIDGSTFGGSIVNLGSVAADALANNVNVATAEGSGDYSAAYAYGGAYAHAFGLQIGNDNSPTVIGDVYNDGTINIHSTAFVANLAAAVGNTAYAYAGAYGSPTFSYPVRASAFATATGLYASLSSLSGKLINSGNITVDVNATNSSSAKATGTSYAYAKAYGTANANANGLYLYVSNSNGATGISNSGSITLDAVANADVRAVSTASSGAAYAYTVAYASANATGLEVQSNINGDFHNSTGGSMSVHATALLNAAATAKATGVSSYGSAHLASPSVGAYAVGIYDNGNSITGNFINDGALTVGANASGVVFALASSTGVSAGVDATIYDNEGGAEASAAGIYLNVNSIGGSFTNNGQLDVSATAHYAATVSALGAAGNGENSAYSFASATASAVGVDLSVSSMIGDVINTGNITITAKADTDSSAKATSGSSANAYAANDEGYNYATAHATGIDAYVGTFGGSFGNSGEIKVNGTATALANASANGPSSYATADGYARAYATGVSLTASNMTSVGGTIENSSLIDVAAKALASATLLLAASGSAYASARARGRGFEVYSDSNIANGLANTGDILVNATATANASATNYGIAYAWATADATGFHAYAQSLSGGFVNSGGATISAIASASAVSAGSEYAPAYARATATGVSLTGYTLISGGVVNNGTIAAEANAYGSGLGGYDYARAIGLNVYTNGNLNGPIHNTGDISATAIASGVDAYNIGATATGVRVQVNGIATGDTYAFYNSGTIKAKATAADYANAYGVDLIDGSYAGAFVNVGSYSTNEGAFVAVTGGIISAQANATGSGSANAVAVRLRSSEDGTTFGGGLINSGLIKAVASAASGTAAATAILVEGGAYLGGDTITNTGIISASATGVSHTAVAINLDGAGGGTLIEQLGQKDEVGNVFGGIYGDIKMAQTSLYADTINWTGGEIVGDIHGDTADAFNVYSGAPSIQGAFVFSGNINAGASNSEGGFATDSQRFGVLNVNTGNSLASAASLEASGNMFLGALNVQHNGTLIVDPTAQIDATSVTIAGTSTGPAATVQWNIKPTIPQNGSITGEVTIDAGANSVAYGEAGLFAKNNDFWVIKDPTGVTGTFSTTANGTVTPLGNFLNGLYTVSDEYRADGYHIIVNRISFADIPGLTTDGTNFGNYIDTVLDYLQQNDPAGPLATLLGQILTGTPEEYARAVNELSGHQNGDLLLAAMGDPAKLLDIIFSQLGGGDLGGSGGVASLETMVRVADNGVAASSVMSDAGPQYAALGSPTSVVARPASAWVRVFGNWSSLDRDATVGSNGYTANGGGVVVGGDYRFSDTFKAGVAGGYQKNKADFRGAGNADIESYSLSVYGRVDQGPLYVNGLMGASRQTYDMTRYYTPIATTYAAHRAPDGTAYSAGAEVGYAFDMGDKSKVTPFAGILFSHTTVDGGTETGTGPGNLTISEQSANSTASRLGVRWSKTFETEGGSSWTPILELGWRHEFSDTNPTSTATLAGLPGSFTVNGSDVPADAALVGLGLKLQLSDAVDGTVQYNGDFTSKSTNSTASIKLRMKF